jgi:ribose transport system permease protein
MTRTVRLAIRVREYSVKYPQIGTVLLLIVMSVVFYILSPIGRNGQNVFLSWRNLFSVLELSSAFSIGAFAMTMVLLTGGIDLSCGSVIALTGVITAQMLTNMRFAMALATPIGLLIGVLCGLLNAFVIIEMKITPFLATLAIGNALRGLSYVITGGRQIWIKDKIFINLFGFGKFLGVPALVWWTLFFLLTTYLLIWRTKFGRRLQAIGGNERAAENSGVNIRRTKYITYGFTGFVGAFISMTIIARIETAMPTTGQGYELSFIVASILGGTTFTGEGGSVFGALLGSLVVAVFNNGLNLLGVDAYLQMLLQGILIIVIIVASVNLLKKK